MSDLVDFEDLNELDGGDLRAVFDQVSSTQVRDALSGSPLGLRNQLLVKLPRPSAERISAQLDASGPISFEDARAAQRAMVEALCELSRSGVVAFDDPEDMVA
ncbi:MAG: FliG C-terminal domain-containing protein [Isosphaeraceae bacterium]|nr:FliG C-terminal domain-containing protein [Isosphaeraceae bacterium]